MTMLHVGYCLIPEYPLSEAGDHAVAMYPALFHTNDLSLSQVIFMGDSARDSLIF